MSCVSYLALILGDVRPFRCLYILFFNPSAVSLITLRVDTHLCKLRDTPAE